MKAGGTVTYVDAKGKDRDDTPIVAVTGTGPSWYKRLSLDVDGKVKEDVPHLNDARKGQAHWRESGTPAMEPAPMPEIEGPPGVPMEDLILPEPGPLARALAEEEAQRPKRK